jgi:hypothetical protein
MSDYQTEYKPKADSGNLHATKSKKSEKSPDYFGEIAINMNDKTNIVTKDGLTIIKLSGWKRQSKAGKTYLSIGVSRFVPEGSTAQQDDDTDVPF